MWLLAPLPSKTERVSPSNAKKPTDLTAGLSADMMCKKLAPSSALKPVLTASGFARQKTFALSPLARQLACAADSFSLLTRFLFRRFFEVTAKLHFTEDAFALHLFLERLKRLIDIIVANQNLHAFFPVFNTLRSIPQLIKTMIEARLRQTILRLL
ncbi:hypothetical protein LAX5112_03151 [Roseibium alexandrii]|jgi:hypothetical protein|uniref:Uncharacterized protein n=1 Tax=Roseibium alexandrii TaxID=388408 RepID=A0A0M7AFD3_9HYPH|nr:hypothetical protein LAX5112_03151 [Roseibium alexandrii]